jgi:hypothetical protein
MTMITNSSSVPGYVFQIAFLDFAIKNGARIEEIPLKFYERRSGVSKINSPQFIFQSLFYIFLNSDFIHFVIVGFLGFLIGGSSRVDLQACKLGTGRRFTTS